MSVKPLRAIPIKVAPIDVPIVGTVCGYDPEQGLLVDFPQNLDGQPVPARFTVALDKTAVEAAVAERQKVVLVFEQGDARQPIVVGLVQPLAVTERPAARLAEVGLPTPPTEARLDGKRVILEAAEELVLRCGPASLILRRNGMLQIKGAYVVSHASGVNRIRGGSVQIN